MRTPTPVAVWADAVPVPDPPTIRSAIPVAVWADDVPEPDPVITPADASTPSSPNGAEARGENPSMSYSGLAGQSTEKGNPSCFVISRSV